MKSLLPLVFLACPLVMIWCMRGMGRRTNNQAGQDTSKGEATKLREEIASLREELASQKAHQNLEND